MRVRFLILPAITAVLLMLFAMPAYAQSAEIYFSRASEKYARGDYQGASTPAPDAET